MAAPLRFVLDVHLGKLATYLRMFGLDAMYEKKTNDRELLHYANFESRILLSRDRLLVESCSPAPAYRIHSNRPKEQLREVFQRFDLSSSIRPLERCLECNAHIASVEKEAVEGKVPDGVLSDFEEFYTCEQCGKIYWKGSHYDSMMSFVSASLAKNQDQ